jgi:hypothetical protein
MTAAAWISWCRHPHPPFERWWCGTAATNRSASSSATDNNGGWRRLAGSRCGPRWADQFATPTATTSSTAARAGTPGLFRGMRTPGATAPGMSVVVSTFTEGGRPVCNELGDLDVGENRAPTLVMSFYVVTLMKASPLHSTSTRSCCFRGNPKCG